MVRGAYASLIASATTWSCRARWVGSSPQTLNPAARSLLEVEPGASINVVTTAEDTGDRALVETGVYDRRTEKDRTVVGWMLASALEPRRDDEVPPEDSLADIHDVVIDDLSGEAAPPAIEDIDGDDSEDDTARE